MKLRPTSMLLNFALITCFAPSMFGSDSYCMFELELHDPVVPTASGRDTLLISHQKANSQRRHQRIGLDLDDVDSTHSDSFDEEIFVFEDDKTASTQLVAYDPSAPTYDRDDAEESDEDIPDYDTDLLPTIHYVAKSTAITIRPRSQSDLFHVKPKGKQRERSGSDPIAIPGSDAKLSAKAENFSIGLHALYKEYDFKSEAPLKEHSLFHKLLKMSKKLSFKEIKLALDSLPRDSHSTFAFKIELFSLFMSNQTALIKEK